MKNYLRILLFLLMPFCVCAQNLSDANSFTKVIALAKKKDKSILLIISSIIPADKVRSTRAVLESEDVVKKMKSHFVVFEANVTDTNITKIKETYKINKFPTFLFMHADGNAFYSNFGYNYVPQKYIDIIDQAYVLSKEKSISDLEKDYLSDRSNNSTLKKMIELRRKNGITDNAKLIEEYVNLLKIEDFNNYQTVLFVLQAGPYSDGKAYKLAHTNRRIIDSVYKTESAQSRSNFNNYIIDNTMTNAIKTKNFAQARAAAIFLRGTWGNDYETATKNYNSKILSYYSAVNDTTNYLKNAVQHYDFYYMNISADSIKKIDEKQRKIALERSNPFPNSKILSKQEMDSLRKKTISKQQLDSLQKKFPNAIRTQQTFAFVTPVMSNSYANTLNSAAWKFYETGTTNINYLTKAMIWSRRSIELDPNASYYDTLAHILYRMGYQAEAVKTQELALNKAKTDGQPYENMQIDLKKMKSKSL